MAVGLTCLVSQGAGSSAMAQEPRRSAAPATSPADDRPPLATRRIVKAFDFDEQSLGNFGTLPMGWRRHGGAGFPLYLEGRFDHEIGQAKPPSFRLDLDGGSIGYHYEGRDIAVRLNSDYLIVALVRTAGLDTARAYIAAYLLDRHGQVIAGTERASEFAGGTDTDTDWEPLTIPIRCDIPEARYMGLSLWLTQQKIWDHGSRPARAIEHEDIKASAWFDDLVVYRMPRVALRTAQPGQVFGENDPVAVLAEVSDPDGLNLAAQLTLRSIDGHVHEEREVAVQTADQHEPQQLVFADLPVGLYEAELVVSTEGATLVRQGLRLARVAGRTGPPVATGHGFGVILSDIPPAVLSGQQALLQELRPDLVKVPVWHAQSAFSNQPLDRDAVDAYLEAIRQTQADPVGMLMDDPGFSPAADGTRLMAMLDMFNEDPLAWKHLVAPTWTRYAGLIHVWQLGDDNHTWVGLDSRLSALVPRLREQMSDLMTEPLLAVTSSAIYASPSAGPGNYRSVLVPSYVNPADFAAWLGPLVGQDADRLWVTVEALPESPYPRMARLADLGKRLVETYAQGVGTVFMRAPWEAAAGQALPRTDPLEDFIILRTVADVLGDAKPISRTSLDGRVQCLVFDRNDSAILCVWDDDAPPEGEVHQLLLGDNLFQVDLWGRKTPLPTTGRYQSVRIGPTPTFILNALTWMVEFRRQFVARPTTIEASFDNLEFEIEFRNTYHDRIGGILRLMLPEGWELRPNRLPFSLAPGEVFRHKISLRFPLNAEARTMPLLGEFALDADRRYVFTTPAWFEFGLKGIDSHAFAFRSRDQVTVRLMMTNRTGRTVHFESYVVAPDRQRIERLVSNFEPGQTILRTFVISEAADLAGRDLRVGLREIQGTRMWNQVVAVP